MKKLIITLILGLFISNAVYAENVVVNPPLKAGKGVETYKIKTDEGMYRVFIVYSMYGVSMQVVKIEKDK